MKMNKKVKKLWVAALNSGNYKQCRGQLNDCIGGYCCLGVLCDLHAEETGQEWTAGGHYLTAVGHLPNSVIEWAGLDKGGGAVETHLQGTKYQCLTNMNDGQRPTGGEGRGPRRSFKQIANWINKYL